MGGCVAVPSASAPDRQAVYGYDGHCIVVDSQARAIYTTRGSLSQRIYDECLTPPAPPAAVYPDARVQMALVCVSACCNAFGAIVASASPRRLRLSTLGVSTYPYWASAPMHSGDASMYLPGGSNTFLGGERPCNHPVPIVIRQV